MNNYETWFNTKWRPAIGWSYMIICVFDFMAGPILFSMIQLFVSTDLSAIQKWEPLTLQANGLYHFSMMAIVGVTSYGRTREKLETIMKTEQVKK